MTPPATVSASASSTPAPAAPAAQPNAQPQTQPVDAAALQRQIDDLKAENAEVKQTAQYWAEKAKGGGEKPAPKAEEPEEDILDTIATRGAKGFDELARKRGFIKREEVEELVDSKAAHLTKEQELLSTYPDLKKKDSAFFKATALSYGDLIKNGTPPALAMEIAAQKTELQFIREGKMKIPGSASTKEEKEAERLARIAAQSGDRGGRANGGGDPEDDELTPEQKHIARSMGISEEAYAARAKKGVSVKGGNR